MTEDAKKNTFSPCSYVLETDTTEKENYAFMQTFLLSAKLLFSFLLKPNHS